MPGKEQAHPSRAVAAIKPELRGSDYPLGADLVDPRTGYFSPRSGRLKPGASTLRREGQPGEQVETSQQEQPETSQQEHAAHQAPPTQQDTQVTQAQRAEAQQQQEASQQEQAPVGAVPQGEPAGAAGDQAQALQEGSAGVTEATAGSGATEEAPVAAPDSAAVAGTASAPGGSQAKPPAGPRGSAAGARPPLPGAQTSSHATGGGFHAEPESVAGAAHLWEAMTGQTPPVQEAACNALLQQFQSQAGEQAVGFQAEATGQATQAVGTSRQAAQQVMQEALTAVQAQVKSAFAAARQRVDASAAAFVGQVDAASQAGEVAVAAAAGARHQALRTETEARKQQAAARSRDGVAALQAAYAQAAADVAADAQLAAEQARATGESSAAAYLARGGEGIEAERNQARAKAAREVGEGYAKQILDSSATPVKELQNGGAGISAALQTKTSEFQAQLDGMCDAASAAVDQHAEQARRQVTQGREQALRQAETSRQDIHRVLGQKEAATQQALHDAWAEALRELDSAEAQSRQQLEQAIQSGSDYFHSEAGALSEAAGQVELPAPGDVRQALSQASAELPASRIGLAGVLRTAASQVDQRFMAFARQQAARFQKAGQEASAGAALAGDGAAQTFTDSGSAYQEQMEKLKAGVQQGLEGLQQQYSTQTDTAVQSFSTAFEGSRSQVMGELGKFRSGMQARLQQVLGGEPQAISQEAEKAASKVQPGWKKFLAAVAGVVVAVAVVAFAVATFGTGLLVLAAAGAIAGGLGLLAKDSMLAILGAGNSPLSAAYWTGDKFKEYGIAIILGGVAGGLGSVAATLKLGIVSTGLLEGLGNALADVGVRTGLFHEPFDLTAFVVTALGAGLVGGMGAFVKVRLDGKFLKAVTGTTRGGNSWNGFQRGMKDLFGSGLSSNHAAVLYRSIKNLPSKTVQKVLSTLGKMARDGLDDGVEKRTQGKVKDQMEQP
jgi:hypothetical protein